MSKSEFGDWESQGPEADAVLFHVASMHQIFATEAGGMVCLCGARPVTHRSATEHILDEAVKALQVRAEVVPDIYARCPRAPRGWWNLRWWWTRIWAKEDRA